MADKKISELPKINTISGSTVILPIVHDGTTQQMDVSTFGVYTSQWSATTASNTFIGNQTVNGNVVITGKLTAQELFTEITSASIIFESGSTIFGNSGDDTHQFTGVVSINGVSIGAGAINEFTASQLAVNLRIASTTGSINTTTSSFNSEFIKIGLTTSSIHFTTQSLNTQTGSQDLVNLRISSTTGSINTTTSSFDSVFLRISSTTGSINTTTSSFDSVFLRISSTTGSINTTTSSFDSEFIKIGSTTSSIHFTTQSLNTQTGSQANLNEQIGIATASLNFSTGALNAFTGSVIGQTNTISTFTASVNFTTQSLNTQTGSQDLVNIGISSVTGSINTTTSSFNSVFSQIGSTTSSLIGITNGLMAFTAALDSTYATDAQLYQLYAETASIKAEIGGIEAYTASLKAATIVSSSTQIFTGYDYEIHVSQVDGNDTTGNGDLLTPVATITKALQIVSSSYLSTDRRTIIIHPGTYTESPTVTLANTYIFALGELGANTAIAGTLTINAACRVSGIKMTNLVVNTTTAVYINNTTVDTQMTVTNTGYLETTGCSFQCPSGVTISGAAPAVIFNTTTLWGLVVNNASAVVIVRNSPQVLIATVTAGNLALSNTLLFSSTPTGNAITTSAGTVVTLSNLNILDNTGLAVARVSLSGFYSIIDVVYDKPNSTLVALSGTGGPLNAIDYFQYINADKFITQGGTGYQFLKGDGSLDSIMPASLQQTTASLNLTTGSLIGITNGLMAFTAALDSTYATDAQLYQLYAETASIKAEIGGIEAYTASLKGAAIVSSSQQITNYNLFAYNTITSSAATTFYGKVSIATTQSSAPLTVKEQGTVGAVLFRYYGNTSNGDYMRGYWTSQDGVTGLAELTVNGNVDMIVGTSTTAPLKLYTNSATAVEINYLAGANFVGAVTASNFKVPSGGGIDFSATSNGSGTMTSELLNDYEEGTWTPTFAGTGGNSGQVYATQDGTYTKVGRLVTFSAILELSTLGTITGFVRIDGLPFAPAATPVLRPATTVTYNTTMTTIPASVVYGSNSFMYLYKISQTNPTSATQLSQGDLTATTVWSVNGFYYTA